MWGRVGLNSRNIGHACKLMYPNLRGKGLWRYIARLDLRAIALGYHAYYQCFSPHHTINPCFRLWLSYEHSRRVVHPRKLNPSMFSF